MMEVDRFQNPGLGDPTLGQEHPLRNKPEMVRLRFQGSLTHQLAKPEVRYSLTYS